MKQLEMPSTTVSIKADLSRVRVRVRVRVRG